MGTKSKLGWNSRCVDRGPLSDIEITRVITILDNEEIYSRKDRRWAIKKLRHAIKWIRGNASPTEMTLTQADLLSYSYLVDLTF